MWINVGVRPPDQHTGWEFGATLAHGSCNLCGLFFVCDRSLSAKMPGAAHWCFTTLTGYSGFEM